MVALRPPAETQAHQQAHAEAVRQDGVVLEAGRFSPAVAQRREYRDVIVSEGLQFVGLHWLLVSPPGLHVTTPETDVWERSWRHVGELVDLCADLGDGGVMVFGSPKQRETGGVQTPGEA